MMLKRSDERGQPSFISDLSRKASSFLLLSMSMIAVGFYIDDDLYPVKKIFLHYQFSESFYHI